MTAPTHEVDMGFTSEYLAVPAHICLIYESEAERDRIATAYMTAGLRKGETVRYLSDGTSAERVRAWLAKTGLPADEVEKSGAFGIFGTADAYCPGGHFDPYAMIERLKARYKAAEKSGYKGTRSCGEMAWVLKGIPGAERWLEYESLLNAIEEPFPHSGMCQYDARLFDGATLFKILQVHPQIIARGQIVRNPFYTRPEEYLPRADC